MNQKKPIRVLQVLTIMNRGGAETMIMNYYRNMDRNKVQFDFLLHRKEEGAYDNEILELGGKIYKLGAIHPLRYRAYHRELDHFFRSYPDYFIIHSHLNALSFIVLGMARKLNIPVRIAHSHLAVKTKSFTNFFGINTDRKAIVKDLLQHVLRHKVREVATHQFACGIDAGNWLFGENKMPFKVINNAIDARKFSFDMQKRTVVRENLGLQGKTVIGHVGRFNEQKNHSFLIKIFKELAIQNNSMHLVLIGDGNLRPRIEEMVNTLALQGQVSFLGIRKDIDCLLQAMDIFLFPSLYEGLPVTLVEAQAAGLKIFTSTAVARESDLTGLIHFIPLEREPKYWASQILSEQNYDRTDTLSKIKDGNYDVEANARMLEEFYLNQSKE